MGMPEEPMERELLLLFHVLCDGLRQSFLTTQPSSTSNSSGFLSNKGAGGHSNQRPSGRGTEVLPLLS
jgi:hypothetical protein